jgi:uncharacterized SAM-binding protein YcdF (DUF218 family)
MLRQLLGLAVLPLSVVVEMWVVAAVLRRVGWRKAARVVGGVAFTILWAASTPAVAGARVRGLAREHLPIPVADAPAADAIVLLGGAVGPAKPPRLDPDLADGADRVWLAARLWTAHKAPIVIATGGRDPREEAGPESRDMKALLVAWGVAADAVVEDPAALDTRGNATGTKAILDARGLRRVLLVTSALHMPRALAAFRAAGVDAVACPTDFLAFDGGERSLLDFLPDAEALQRVTQVVHERMGTLWYRLRGWA